MLAKIPHRHGVKDNMLAKIPRWFLRLSVSKGPCVCQVRRGRIAKPQLSRTTEAIRAAVAFRTAVGILAGLLSAAVGAGCVAPEVRFVRTDCTIDGGQYVQAMTFRSTIELADFETNQMIYRVRLLDRASAPVISRNHLYRDSDGNVCASRSFMVMQPLQTINDISVTIPASELELELENHPMMAEFSVEDADGVTLTLTVQRFSGQVLERLARHRHSIVMPPETGADEDAEKESEPEVSARLIRFLHLVDRARHPWKSLLVAPAQDASDADQATATSQPTRVADSQ